jgi:hypothetical protein
MYGPNPEQDGLVRQWKASEREDRGGKKSRRKVCGKKEKTGDSFVLCPQIKRKECLQNKDMEEETSPLLTEQIRQARLPL